MSSFWRRIEERWPETAIRLRGAWDRFAPGQGARRALALALPPEPTVSLRESLKATVSVGLVAIFTAVALSAFVTLVTALIFIYLLVTKGLGIRIDVDPEAMAEFMGARQ